jgi:catechol 2,3-dioxygenase-like lactoylglutathione lyase family enzyme
MKVQPRFGFVVQYVKDINAAKQFYERVLGLRPERAHPNYVQFEHFAIASDAPMGDGRELEVYWLIDDAEASFQSIPPEVEIVLPLREVPFGKVYGIRDPDGQPQYLLQLAATRPSQPVR